MLDLPFFDAVIEVAISGNEVPNAIIVRPINESEICNVFEILIAASTVISAPKRVIVIAIIEIGKPYLIGCWWDRFENKSFSKLDSSTVSDSELLKLLNKYNRKSNKKIKPKFLFKNENKKIHKNKKCEPR